MKKIIFCLIVLLSFAVNAEYISNFKREISIRNDGSAFVYETIEYNFGDLRKHGIFRNLEVNEISGITNFMALLENEPVKYSVNYNNYDSSNVMQFKIGDASKTVDGTKKYIISYFLEDAVRIKNGKKILNINLFRYWDVPVEKFEADILYEDGNPISKNDFNILKINNKKVLDLEQNTNLLKIKGENLLIEIYDIKGEIKNPNVQPVEKNKISSFQKNKTGNGDVVVFILGIIALISLPFAFMIDDGKTGGNSDSSSDNSYYDSGSYGGGDCGGGYSGGGSW